MPNQDQLTTVAIAFAKWRKRSHFAMLRHLKHWTQQPSTSPANTESIPCQTYQRQAISAWSFPFTLAGNYGSPALLTALVQGVVS